MGDVETRWKALQSSRTANKGQATRKERCEREEGHYEAGLVGSQKRGFNFFELFIQS